MFGFLVSIYIAFIHDIAYHQNLGIVTRINCTKCWIAYKIVCFIFELGGFASGKFGVISIISALVEILFIYVVWKYMQELGILLQQRRGATVVSDPTTQAHPATATAPNTTFGVIDELSREKNEYLKI